MKQTAKKLKIYLSSFVRDELNLFYVLAFFPLILMAYFQMEWPFGVVIPIFGFILLTLKKPRLFLSHESGNIQKILGLLLILGSFFVYYALAPFFTSPTIYGSANYAVYIFGLFLVFFDIHSLKEAFTPLFLIVAATSTSSVSRWLEPYFTPYIPQFVSFIAAILRTLGIEATTQGSFIVLHTVSGNLPMNFIWGCVGVTSMLIFSVILVVVLFEESTSIPTKLLWGFFGILGTFIVNIVRVTIIFVADYFYGSEVGGKIHYTIGYTLFTTWLAIFFFLFSKRQAIHEKIQSVRKKLSQVAEH